MCKIWDVFHTWHKNSPVQSVQNTFKLHYLDSFPCSLVVYLKRLTVIKTISKDRAVAQAVISRSPTAPARFDPGSVRVGFVVDKVALGQVFPRELRFSNVSFILPVLHYREKVKKLIIFIIGLHNKPQGCGASIASAAGSFSTKRRP
jgi:hypothetical protein